MQVKIDCLINSGCPFQYYCDQGACLHQPMFPLQVYPTIVYFLIPFFITVCNIGGLSGGIFKVVILMDMLNYRVSEATTLAYAMITGGALANFILLLPRRHPKIDAPLVDHGLVFVLLPCILLGTTVGVIINKLLYDLIQYILVVIVCLYFAYKYFLKYRHKKRVERKLSADSQASTGSLLDGLNQSVSPRPETPERRAFDEYQSGYHVRSVLLGLLFFIILQVLTALCQGKIVKFKHCSSTYFISFGAYIICMVMIIFGCYKFSQMRMNKYRRVGFDYSLKLDKIKVYTQIVAGGIIAGLLQGIIGMGSGHMISLVLLALQFTPEVTSATSGYIIFFVGSASLVESFMLDDSNWQEMLLIGGVTFVGSLILTYLVRGYLKKRSKLDKVIIFILALICVVSILGVVVSFIMDVTTLGFEQFIEPKQFCE